MEENIGSKIKNLAKILSVIESIASVIITIYLITKEMFLLAFLLTIPYILVNMISYYLLYGFAELIDKVSEIAANTKKNSNTSISKEEQEHNDNIQKIATTFNTNGIMDIPKRKSKEK